MTAGLHLPQQMEANFSNASANQRGCCLCSLHTCIGCPLTLFYHIKYKMLVLIFQFAHSLLPPPIIVCHFMLEKLSTLVTPTCYPYPYARFENKHLVVFPILLKGSTAGISDFSPSNLSLNLPQESWQRSRCSYTLSTGNCRYHFVHYFHILCCPSKCILHHLSYI